MGRPDFDDAYLGDDSDFDDAILPTGYVSESADQPIDTLIASGMPTERPAEPE